MSARKIARFLVPSGAGRGLRPLGYRRTRGDGHSALRPAERAGGERFMVPSVAGRGRRPLGFRRMSGAGHSALRHARRAGIVQSRKRAAP